MRYHILILLLAIVLPMPTSAQDNQQTNQAIDAIRQAGQEGAGFQRAIQAANRLRSTSIERLNILLDGMADVNPVAENWIRGIVFDVVRRADQLPVAALSEYAMDKSNNPTGRGLAMELIRKDSPETAETLISKCLDDDSLPLREMAVQQKIESALEIKKDKPESAKNDFQQALTAARHPKQLETIVEELRDLGDEDVSIKTAFAMIESWHALAPLNNVGDVGYDTEYAPEQEFIKNGSVDLAAQHDGKDGPIKWQEVAAEGDRGKVNLAKAYDKEKGAVSYMYTEFESSSDQLIQVRLTSKNANKVWVNGELAMANHVYHSGSAIDQYVADAQLKKGTNRILLKICQNEQEQPWAQDWDFQFRITDRNGKALRSEN